jgi:hypothetical protein
VHGGYRGVAQGAGRMWLAAAVLLGGVIPFTLVVIKPVSDALLQGGDVSAVDLDGLLVRWGYLHWARTAASGLAFPLCLVGLRLRPGKLLGSSAR